jgi:RNA polymerase sigma-70 factor (ECF subfamily)
VTYQAFDDDYVNRLIAQDPETEHQFISYFNALLVIKLKRTLRTRQAMEDVRQETFLRVFRAIRNHSLAKPERLGAFVNGVCNNVLAEYYRSVSRTGPLPAEGLDSSAEYRNPETELQAEERKRDVHGVLKELPAKDQEILRLIFIEEQEKDEVCRRCGVDRGYLRVMLHRAKNRFRNQLPKEGTASRSASV